MAGAATTDPRSVSPGDRPVVGPLAAARIRFEDWAAVDPIESAGSDRRRLVLVYTDLDLADRAATIDVLGLDHGAGDDEIVLAAHRRWGDDAPGHLVGQFAYAFWDTSRSQLVAVRDHVGLRPLVYARVPDGIVLGGDLGRVLEAGGISRIIDESTFIACVLRNHTAQLQSLGRTCYRDVDLLRPAHVLVAGRSVWRQRRYWNPEDVAVERLRSPADHAADLAELLLDVVGDLTPGDGAVGSHLSGAVDSSVVTALAARTRAAAGADPPVAFSWQPGPEHGRGVDHDRIESVTAPYGLPTEYCPPTIESMLAEALADATVDAWTMMRHEAQVQDMAAARAVRTILTGYGGDEAVSFSGRGLVERDLLRHGRVTPVVRAAVTSRSAARRVAGAVVPRQREPQGWHQTNAQRRASVLAGKLHLYLRPEVLRAVALPEVPLPPADPHARIRWLFANGHLATRAGDWARSGAAHEITYRHPLLDQRVVRFVLGLPTELWLPRDGDDRWLIRAAADGVVADPARRSGKSEPVGGAHVRAVRADAAAQVRVDLATADPQRLALFDQARIERRLGETWGPATALKWLGVRTGTCTRPSS